jgi:undecaprenyl-diphosphatase
LCGADKQQASRFSFLLSIPIILASIAYELLDVIINQKPFFDVGVLPTLLAFVSAFVVGLLCVKFMLTVFQKINLWWFSAYLIIIAGVSFFAL